MAQENEVSPENPIDFIFDKLQEVFSEFMTEFRKINLKNKKLKK